MPPKKAKAADAKAPPKRKAPPPAAAHRKRGKTETVGGVKAEAPPGPETIFEPNETVYARDSSVLFEAKILRCREDPSVGQQYFVHFQGWSAKWDTWVGPGEIFKDTPATQRKAKDLAALAKARKKKAPAALKMDAAAATATADGEDPDGAARAKQLEAERRAKRAKLKEQQLFEDAGVPQLRMGCPMSLKSLAVDDWEKVTSQSLVVPLPRELPITEVLRLYLAFREAEGLQEHERPLVQKFTDELQSYFNEAVGALLLYREEAAQWRRVQERSLVPAQVFGAEHLLRLLIKLPFLVRTQALLPRELTSVKREVTALLQFLQKDKSVLFLEEYVDLDTGVRGLDEAAEASTAEASTMASATPTPATQVA